MIRFERVGLHYPTSGWALKDVSVSIVPGALNVITGRSGAGKSSFLKLLYGALQPSAGRLSLLGGDAARLARRDIANLRRRIGVVFQDFQLLDHLTVFENVALPLVVTGRREDEYRNNALEMLEWVKLSDKLRHTPAQLSGGEKQCVAIARAMVSVPELILADEPTGSVDPEMGERIMTLFQEMHRLGRTVLIATHDAGVAHRLRASRLHLERGRLLRLERAA